MRDEIVKLYKEGLSIAQVSEELDCSRHAVQVALRETNTPRRGNSPLNRAGARPAIQQPRPVESTARREGRGNCVLCKHAIGPEEPYTRREGILGKICQFC